MSPSKNDNIDGNGNEVIKISTSLIMRKKEKPIKKLSKENIIKTLKLEEDLKKLNQFKKIKKSLRKHSQ